MSMTTAQIDASLRQLRRKMRRLVEARREAECREARDAAVLRAFDAGDTNCERLAERHGMKLAAVRSLVYRTGRSVIVTRHERLRAVAQRHVLEAAQ